MIRNRQCDHRELTHIQQAPWALCDRSRLQLLPVHSVVIVHAEFKR